MYTSAYTVTIEFLQSLRGIRFQVNQLQARLNSPKPCTNTSWSTSWNLAPTPVHRCQGHVIVARQRKTKTDDGEKTKGERERETEYRSTSSKAFSLSLFPPSVERAHRSSTVQVTGRLTGSLRKQCRLYLIKESGCHGNCEVNERSIDSAHLNSGQPLTEYLPPLHVEYPTHSDTCPQRNECQWYVCINNNKNWIYYIYIYE